ncbi:hypothetical protein GcC1_123001 [Golovinomyces cichoracearum]|uniref:Uncharacterized protein n=1 Tax=Golovinomyces cichoracearum TaxID=62708 RepID=A0A420I6K1_9PEZI|nr:hypothetical protein GcC1_123001 [Golovinomyces cichoracearum]
MIAGKTEYTINAWGSTRVRFLTKEGDAFIVLRRTALVTRFINNLVSLPLVIEGGVHWSSRSPVRLEKEDRSEFCKLFRGGKNIIFEEEIVSVAKLAKNKEEGRILGDSSPEVINHVINAARDGKIEVLDDIAPRTKDFQTCALAKPHEIVSRCSGKSIQLRSPSKG